MDDEEEQLLDGNAEQCWTEYGIWRICPYSCVDQICIPRNGIYDGDLISIRFFPLGSRRRSLTVIRTPILYRSSRVNNGRTITVKTIAGGIVKARWLDQKRVSGKFSSFCSWVLCLHQRIVESHCVYVEAGICSSRNNPNTTKISRPWKGALERRVRKAVHEPLL